MSAATKIEWCDATVNWWAGCTKVSPACDHCYAEKMAGRLWGTQWGADQPRRQFDGAAETLRALDRKAKRLGRPLMVFHNSLSDFFDNAVSVQWRYTALRMMLETPNLIHLLLTKRIGNAADMLEQSFRAVHGQREGWADNVPPNIWIGATICNQEEANRDIPKLLAVPAKVRFLSMEPLLENVTVFDIDGPIDVPDGMDSHLHWVIVGGESGPQARPMHPDWTRSLRDQCEAAGVPFLFKQWGEWSPGYAEHGNDLGYDAMVYADQHEWLEGHCSFRVGKKAAGRQLDGRTWDGVPA